MKPIKKWGKDDLIEFIKRVDKKTWIAIMVGLIAFILLWGILIGPAWLERPRLRRQIQSMDAQMRLYHALNQKRLIWEEDEKTFSRIIQDTKSSAYKEDEVALLLRQVSKLANDAGVDMIASKPKSEKVNFPAPYQDRFQTVSYDFTMQGGYHSFGKLAAGIESYPKLLRIQTLQIVPMKDNPEKHVAQFGLMAITERVASGMTPPSGGVSGASNVRKK